MRAVSTLPSSPPRHRAVTPASAPGRGTVAAVPGGRRAALSVPLLLAIVLATAFSPVGGAAAAREADRASTTGAPDDGDVVTVTGTVTDGTGQAIAGVHVVLEAAHRYFSLRHLERKEKDLRRVTTRTGEDGSYSLQWRWDDWFNRLELGVAIPVRRPARAVAGHGGATGQAAGAEASGADPDDGRSYHFLERVDLSRRLANGGSTVVPLVLEDTEFLDAVRRFEATLQSDDQRRVYGKLGYPDEVTVVELPDGDEASWWYFDRGEVYRFVGGELQEVEPFEPVTRF